MRIKWSAGFSGALNCSLQGAEKEGQKTYLCGFGNTLAEDLNLDVPMCCVQCDGHVG